MIGIFMVGLNCATSEELKSICIVASSVWAWYDVVTLSGPVSVKVDLGSTSHTVDMSTLWHLVHAVIGSPD